MLNVWVNRNPTGFETFDMEGIEELEEQLKGIDTFKPLDDEQEIHVEITGPWGEIRQLLSQPFFNKIWFNPESPRFFTVARYRGKEVRRVKTGIQ